jgi:AraC-like DNA-binding protein
MAPYHARTMSESIEGASLAMRLREARAFIQREFRRNPTVREVARSAHLSTYHFHRVFRRYFGTTPKQMILELQIAEVKRLALQDVPFAEAARAVGFAHQAHMIGRFKKIVGTTPGRWLRTIRDSVAGVICYVTETLPLELIAAIA